MKFITLIFLLIPLQSYACSCWHIGEVDKSKSFLVMPIEGEAIYPVSEEEGKKLMGAGEVTTILEVFAPLNSGLTKGSRITFKQRYSMCTAFLLPNGVYRIDSPPESKFITGSRCSIHLEDVGKVPESVDPELVDLIKQVNELDQIRPYAK
ncbi:hypothetical protein [Microbulbifer sp. PAAF003]|uniref:hypothetical protein n=1 Tax=Microbulbifer sp. PAAF003 TaxID=3243375 RepID=UPI004039E82E